MIKLISPQDFFKELLQPTKVSPLLKEYLVKLLVNHIPTESWLHSSKDSKFPTLTFMYKEAIEAPPALRNLKYQKLGDTSLFVAGFYPQALNRRLVDVDFFVNMGTLAYRQVSSEGVFKELSENFTQACDALGTVSDFEPRSEQDVLRLMELYALMPSERLKIKLKSLGVEVPGILNKKWQ